MDATPPDPVVGDGARRQWAWSLGGAVATAGAVVLFIGWFGGVEGVTRVAPGLSSMKVNTAIGLIALGVAPLASRRGSRGRAIAGLAAGLVALLGAATTLEYVAGVDLGIDQLLVTDPDPEGFPGRMGLNTALAFLGLGAAWLLSTHTAGPRRHAGGQLLALAAGTLGAIALLGYLLGATSTRGIGSATEMAVHTAAALVVASLAFAAATSVRGPLAVLWSPLAGGRLARSMLLPGVGTIVVSGLVAESLVQAEWLDEVELQLVLQVTLSMLVLGALVLYAAAGLDAVGEAERQARLDGDLARAKLAALISELEQRVLDRTEELERTVGELEETNADLQQFLFAASHDLKEPLRMVSLYTSRLAQSHADELDQRGQQYIGFAVEGAERMTALIDGIQAFTHAGTGEVNLRMVDLGDLVRAVAAGIPGAADALRVSGEVPAVLTDRGFLTQALTAVFHNAVIYAHPDRRLRIEVAAAQTEDLLEISVADNGVGIPEGQHDRATRMFARLHGPAVAPGSGVGLAVSRRLIGRLGGTLTLHPRPGGGTIVRVMLPAD